MENDRAAREDSVGAWRLRKTFSSFMRCSRRGFLCLLGSESYGGNGIMFVLSLTRLRRVVLFQSRLNAFRSALFCLAVFYANYLPAPQLLAQHSAHAEQCQGHAHPPTGLMPAPATLMAGKLSPIRPAAPGLLAQLDARYGHSHQHHQDHHHHHQMASLGAYGHGGHGSQPLRHGGPSYPPAFGQSMLRSVEVPPQGFGQSLLGSMFPTQAEYLAIEGPPPPYADRPNARAHGKAPAPLTQATVNALHVQKYGGGGWHATRVTRDTATPTVLCNGLAEAQMNPVMRTIPMPRYSGKPGDLDEIQKRCNKYFNDSTIGCNEAQRQRFRLSMLHHCVPANVNKELNNWVEDGRISTWDEIWRAFRKEEVADLPHHAQRRFKAVSLRTLRGHIRVADWWDFRREYRHLRGYVEDWKEESEAARVYNMLPYKWQEKIQAEKQKRGRWRTVLKILLSQQQHQSLLQWINSWATRPYGFNTMKNSLMLPEEDCRMGVSLKAMDKVKLTTGRLKVQAIDPRTTADEIIDFISERMTMQPARKHSLRPAKLATAGCLADRCGRR